MVFLREGPYNVTVYYKVKTLLRLNKTRFFFKVIIIIDSLPKSKVSFLTKADLFHCLRNSSLLFEIFQIVIANITSIILN